MHGSFRKLPSKARRPDGLAVSTVFVLALMLLACVANATDTAGRLLKKGDYAGTAALLRARQAKGVRSARLERNLGIALLRSGDATGALTALRTAREMEPTNRSTLYFLGSAAEATGDSVLALDAYRACLASGGGGLGPVQARVEALVTAQLRRAMVQTVTTERQLSVQEIPVNTLAVPEFALAAGPDSLRPICRGLAAILATDLSKVPQLALLERTRLPVLLQELALAEGAKEGGSGVVNPATAPKLGQLLGARRFAQGSVLPLGADRLQLSGALIETVQGGITGVGAPVEGPVTAVLDLEKRLVFQVLDSLGVNLDASLRRAIGLPVTRSYPAFVAFSHGLDFEALGRSSEAASAYREALRLDPKFTLARERSDVLGGPTGSGVLERRLIEEAVNQGTGADSQQRSIDALGFGPTGTPDNPSGTTRVDDATRLGVRPGLEPLPGFPGHPVRTPPRGGPR